MTDEDKCCITTAHEKQVLKGPVVPVSESIDFSGDAVRMIRFYSPPTPKHRLLGFLGYPGPCFMPGTACLIL